MKIAIVGYSGAGKSTLAKRMGAKEQIPVLHLDKVHHLPGWKERDPEQEREMVRAFLRENDNWVIDGNYSYDLYEDRMEQADRIIMLLFNRVSCFLRAYRRYRKHKGKSRDDMAEGCCENFHWVFIKWVLWEGRRKPARERYKEVRRKYPEKTVVIRNQRQLDRFIRTL